jgi:adenylate cyclase
MRERATVTEAVPLSETARRAGVTPQTLRRWAREGLVPQLRDGLWTPAAIAQARVVARLRERGHTLDEIRAATESGRLAFSFVDELLPEDEVRYTVAEVAELFVAREIDDDG